MLDTALPALTKYSPGRELHLGVPDGAYLSVIGDRAQVIVIGPMRAPEVYERSVSLETGRKAILDGVAALAGKDGETKDARRIRLLRGFIALEFALEPSDFPKIEVHAAAVDGTALAKAIAAAGRTIPIRTIV